MQKIKFKIVFLKEIEGKLMLYKVKTIKSADEIVSIENKSYKIDYSNTCYTTKKTLVYFIDFDSGSQFSFKQIQSKLNPNSLDVFMKNKLIKELASGSISSISKVNLIIMFIFGAVVGFLIGYMYMNQTLMDLLDNVSVPLP